MNSILASGTNISRKKVFLSLPYRYMYIMHPYKRHRPGPVITDLELGLKSNIPSLPLIAHTFFHLLLFPSYYCQLKTTGFTKCRCLIGIFIIVRRICARNMTCTSNILQGGTSNFNHILDTSDLPYVVVYNIIIVLTSCF